MKGEKKNYILIDEVKTWDKNPREISPKDFESLKKKIERWGIWKPFLVWESKMQILGGNQRYKACKELGHKEIWVEYREPKDDAEALEMAIADNESSGEWIKSLLIEQIKLNEDKINLEDYKINIKDTTLKDLMPIDIEEDTPPDEADIQSVTVLGDLYELGNHRVLCGDSTLVDNVEKLMNGKKADMVFTDPPYGINIVSENGKVGAGNLAKNHTYSKVKNDETTETAKNFYNTCLAVGLDRYIMFGGNYFLDFLPFSSCWIIWDKRGEMGSNNFADGEMAWTNIKTPVRIYKYLWNGMIREGEREAKIHPTQKPIAVCNKIISDFSKGKNIIYDGFLGSGSTLIACEKTERICYGMELDEHYCDVIVARYIKYMQDNNKPFTIKRNGEEIDYNLFLKDGK